MPALPVGDSAALRVGEVVVAVGHPLGVPGAATLGIFSGFGTIEGGERNGRHFREALLADIKLRPGNSRRSAGERARRGRGHQRDGDGAHALAVPSATVLRLIGGRARRVLGCGSS
ncbi:MAG: trypsin-like peptidase domain-containing protein [Thermomicrobiales bacterium]